MLRSSSLTKTTPKGVEGDGMKRNEKGLRGWDEKEEECIDQRWKRNPGSEAQGGSTSQEALAPCPLVPVTKVEEGTKRKERDVEG